MLTPENPNAMDEFVLAVATAAGEDVSDGLPTWPDPRTWALNAVREAQRDMDEECQRLHAEVERLRAALNTVCVTYSEWVADRCATSEAVREMNHTAVEALIGRSPASTATDGSAGRAASEPNTDPAQNQGGGHE